MMASKAIDKKKYVYTNYDKTKDVGQRVLWPKPVSFRLANSRVRVNERHSKAALRLT